MRLKGRVAIITGASQSIGRAVAIEFARQGAKVVVNYLSNQQLAENVVNEIKQEGGEAIAVKANVANEQEVAEMVNKTVEVFSNIDILVQV